jgi:glycosyltransferase involved in cell wall biosynthesis
LFLIFKRADLLVSNDLDTLLANYMASKLKPKCKLVYDSHEYFTEVPELINRPKVQKLWLSIEHYIFPKLKTVYTVNQSIADIYRKKYNTNVKVVRNISKRWNPKTILNKSELGIPEDKNLIILQGAGINVDRGAEEALEAMVHLDAVLMIVGDGDVVAQLKVSVLELELSKKVLFYGKKPYHIMMNYTHFADIGLTLDKPSNLNYQLSLPNKVFDYMHTQTAVVATDIKEVSAVIKKHTIGEILTEFTPETLAKKLANLFENPSLLNRYKDNCKIAANIENWETETEILKTIYPHV